MVFRPFSELNRLPEAPNNLYTKSTKSKFNSLVFTSSSSVPVLSHFTAKVRNHLLLHCGCHVDPLLLSSFLPPHGSPQTLGVLLH